MSLSRRTPTLRAFWQAASMAVAVCFLTRLQSPMMDRSASGPRPARAPWGPTGRRLRLAAPRVAPTIGRRRGTGARSRRKDFDSLGANGVGKMGAVHAVGD